MRSIGLLLACGMKRGESKHKLAARFREKALPSLPSRSLTNNKLTLNAAQIEALHEMLMFAPDNHVDSGASTTTRPLHPVIPHINAFPLHLQLMLDKGFVFPLMGLVHIANRIEQLAPITGEAGFRQVCRFGQIYQTPQGWQFEILCETRENGKTVQRATSTYLYKVPRAWRNDGEHHHPSPQHDINDGHVCDTWWLDKSTGRNYARVSGDYNPIHLSATLARLFGFKAAIAHGMFCKGRLLSLYYPERSYPFVVDVSFKKPVTLPQEVKVYEHPIESGVKVMLCSGDSGNQQTLHLQGLLHVESGEYA